MSASPVFDLLAKVKRLAQDYYDLTGGRSLGVTGEVAEFEAVRLLPGLELAPPRQQGYNALRGKEHLQIQGRCVRPHSKSGQRMSRIHLDKEWDVVMLVLLDEHYETTEIHEATRAALTPPLTALEAKAKAAGKAVNGMPVKEFKELGCRMWQAGAAPRSTG
jgi:hypothetical protein